MRHTHPKIYGEICNLHPELNGERYGNKLHHCVGCQKDYLKKWRDENRKVIFGAICQKHPELKGKRKYKMCVACDREKAKERLRLHPGRAAAYTAKWQKNNQDKVKGTVKILIVK